MMPDVSDTRPTQANQIVIAMNPRAGASESGARIERVRRSLEERGYQVQVLCDLDEITEVAGQLHAAEVLRVLVAAGGDGTAAELVNRTPAGLPITIMPLGTENLLARYAGLSANPEAVSETVAAGETVELDAGRANGRIFLLMASCGFDAEVVRRVHSQRSGHVRRWNYAQPIVQLIRSYQYPPLRIYWLDSGGDGHETPLEPLVARWVFLSNLPPYAAGLRIAPGADGTDGQLDLCAFRRGSLVTGLGYLARVVLGRHQDLADCTTGRFGRIRIESDDEVPYQLDGDAGGVLPLDVEVVPRRFRLLIPKSRAAQLAPKPASNQQPLPHS